MYFIKLFEKSYFGCSFAAFFQTVPSRNDVIRVNLESRKPDELASISLTRVPHRTRDCCVKSRWKGIHNETFCA